MEEERRTFSVEVESIATGYVDVEATSEEEAVGLVEGMEIADVRELRDFKVKGAERL